MATLGSRYARSRDAERRRRRTLAVTLGLLCLGLSCRPPSEPVSRPAPAPSPAETESRSPDRKPPRPPQPEPQPIDTRTLLPEPDTSTRPDTSDLPLGPLILRVGLATDLEKLELPCCDARIQATWSDGNSVVPLERRVLVTPADGIERTAVYRLQVAALKDSRQAQGIADYLKAETKMPAESVFDADTDLYRVRVGRFKDREQAEQAKGGLAGLGVSEGWIVSEGGELQNAALKVVHGGAKHRVDGRWLEIDAPGELGIPFGKTRYRGKLLIFLNERGLLNVINEITLESYLRGVVPKEMGPELYNEPEALKAQTVAARTYTLRNLGEFADEGYDICSTPRCQVYGGMAVEHPRSDRAIQDTAGQVLLYEGQPAETLYSATSGGHTENVEIMFPLKSGDYLRGVPCFEAGPTVVTGNLTAGSTFPRGLIDHLLPASEGKRTHQLSARLEHLALLAGLAPPTDRLRSLERVEILRFLMSIYDMTMDRRMADRSKVDELLRPGSDWNDRDRRFASFLRFDGYLVPRGAENSSEKTLLDADAETRLLIELALYLGALEEHTGHFLKLDGDQLVVRHGAEHRRYSMPDTFATYRRRGPKVTASPLDLVPGDALRLYRHDGEILAMVQPVDAPVVVLGKRAPKTR